MRLKASGMSPREICAALDISRSLYYYRVREAEQRGIAYESAPLRRSESAARRALEALTS